MAQQDSKTPDVEYVEAKVIEIIDRRELVINAGPADGVELGMRFAIVGEATIKSDRAPNGTIPVRFKKTIVKAVRFLDDYHTVCRTFKIIKGRPAQSSGLLGAMGSTPAEPDRVEALNVANEATILSRATPEERQVQRGDIAEQTWGEEYEG